MKINESKLKYVQSKVGKRLGIAVLTFVMALGLSSAASADWSADALGEGSGLDRSAAMGGGEASAVNGGEASLRAAIEQTTQMQQIASSFDYSASAGGSFGSGGIGVMAVSAGGGDDMEE